MPNGAVAAVIISARKFDGRPTKPRDMTPTSVVEIKSLKFNDLY